MPRALFTLHDTRNAVGFARVLANLGWDIVATPETSVLLERERVSVTTIADFTGVRDPYHFPPTLHPKIEAYLTNAEGPRIDLVYAIPYPLSVGIDVGGWTLLALAVKGRRISVFTPGDMEMVIAELGSTGMLSEKTRASLTARALAGIVGHYLNLLGKNCGHDGMIGKETSALLNGENPYQIPAHLFTFPETDHLALGRFTPASGATPCFTNLADADCLLQTISLAAQAFARNQGRVPHLGIAAKHGNACGFAMSWDSPAGVVDAALFGNPKAIWGGEFIANFPIEGDLAGKLYKSTEREKLLGEPAWMLDVVMAPDFSAAAVEVLGRRTGRKLLANPALSAPFPETSEWAYRFVRGGFLRQPPNNYILDTKEAVLVGETPATETIESLIIAWATAWSSSLGGNEVALARDGRLIGAGGGPSTVDAAWAAVCAAKRLGHDTKGAVFAANAFLPFTDAAAVLAEAGVGAGLVPAGGKREEAVRSFFSERGIAMLYLPERYRGFSRH